MRILRNDTQARNDHISPNMPAASWWLIKRRLPSALQIEGEAEVEDEAGKSPPKAQTLASPKTVNFSRDLIAAARKSLENRLGPNSAEQSVNKEATATVKKTDSAVDAIQSQAAWLAEEEARAARQSMMSKASTESLDAEPGVVPTVATTSTTPASEEKRDTNVGTPVNPEQFSTPASPASAMTPVLGAPLPALPPKPAVAERRGIKPTVLLALGVVLLACAVVIKLRLDTAAREEELRRQREEETWLMYQQAGSGSPSQSAWVIALGSTASAASLLALKTLGSQVPLALGLDRWLRGTAEAPHQWRREGGMAAPRLVRAGTEYGEAALS